MTLRILALLSMLVLPVKATLRPLDAAGYSRMLQANRGHTVLVSFWATWCEPCREELPRLRDFARQHHVELITISADESESEAAVKALLQRLRLSGPAYRVSGSGLQHLIDAVNPEWSGVLPALFVYDRNGRLAHSILGEVDWTKLNQILEP